MHKHSTHIYMPTALEHSLSAYKVTTFGRKTNVLSHTLMLPLGRWMSDYEINRCMHCILVLMIFVCIMMRFKLPAFVCMTTFSQKHTHTFAVSREFAFLAGTNTQSYVNESGVLRVVGCWLLPFQMSVVQINVHADTQRHG